MSTTISDAMQELRRQFAAQLSERVEAIGTQYERLAAGVWTTAEAGTLHRLVHGLTGSAGTFGMPSLSAAALDLEEHLARHLKSSPADGRPDEAAWVELAAGIDRLRQVAHMHLTLNAPNLKPLPEKPRALLAPLVYLVEDDVEQAAYLGQVLREAGYRVQAWHSAEAFRAAMAAPETERPAAVVMDMVFPEGDHTGAALIDQCGLDRNSGIPVVVVSVLDDLHARLRALRAGVSRYLSKPLQPAQLVDLLDAFTGRQPPEPYRVLLVDDDPLLLGTHAAILREAGMDVLTLSEPLLTLARVASFRPDVLLLDVYMPEVSGPELAAVLRERDENLHLPILFLSAETDMSQQLLALNLGGDDFLVKPIQSEYLVSAVTARARRARQSNAIRKRLQLTLYEREREHLALDQHAIVSITNTAGAITYVNDRFCEISGYTRDELLGQNHRIIKSGEHPTVFYETMWQAISAGDVWHGEVCNRRKNGQLYWVESTITPFLDREGLPYQYVSIRTDISRVKAIEATQREQIAMRQVVNEAAVALLSANVESLDHILTRCLQRACEHLGSDRAYLFQLCDDGAHMSNSHEWCAPGVAPQKDNLQNLQLEMFAWWWAQMEHGKMVHIPDVATMPPEAAAEQALLESQNIRALCAFPFKQSDKTVGFIGFDQVTRTRAWDVEALGLLGLLADQISSALLRTASERAVADSASRLNATLESTKDGILAVSADGQALFMNQQFRSMWKVPDTIQRSWKSDGDLLAHAMTQVKEPVKFMDRVQELYQSSDESDDMIEMADGRIFELHSKPLRVQGQSSGRVWSFHDITSRWLAEQAMESVKERLRRGQLFANIGTWEWNIVSGELFWSERIAPLFGYPSGDLETSYANFLNAVHQDDRQAVIDAVNASLERDIPYEIEHRVEWPDGTVRWLLERGAVQRSVEGKALSMIGVVQDIHDRKGAELALAEREQQLLEAQRLASIGNWSADQVSGELFWSTEIYRIFGREPGSFVPNVETFQAAIHPEDVDLVHQSELQAERTGLLDVTHRIVRPDGTVRHVHELGRMHFDTYGRPLRLTGTVQDVTERVEALKRISETEARFAFAVEGAGDGVWDWNILTGAMPLSGHYEEMLGYEKGELEATVEAWAASVHPDDVPDVQEQLQDYLSGKSSSYSPELRLRCKDGSYKWVLCRGTVVQRDAQGQPLRMIGVHSDISERKKNEAALISARNEADRANKAKSEFLSSMSHELRTPMNAILGFGQLMEYDEALPAEHQDNVKEILKAGSHLLALINEVLDLAKVESGNIDLSLEPIALNAVVEECLALVSALAVRRNIRLSRHGDTASAVRADRTRFKQVLLNLLSNAIKYNHEGGTVRLEVQSAEANRVRILVRDTGIGIPAGRLDEIFQPFNRVGAEDSEIEGTGIGLTITRRLIEMMGGTVDVESTLGEGSVFWIELPRDAVDNTTRIHAGTSSGWNMAGGPGSPDGLTVLYIEDNPANIKLVSQILGRIPHIHLLTAHTAELGIELALARRPALILLDINMPGMDGYQVLEVFKADASLKDVPVVAITANAMPRDIQRGREAGFVQYLTKPLDVPQFYVMVDQLLGASRSQPRSQP